MNVNLSIVNTAPDRFENLAPLRVIASAAAPAGVGAAWRVVAADASDGADCWLVAAADVPGLDIERIMRSALPLVLVPEDTAIPASWIDHADDYVLPGDDIADVLRRATQTETGPRVADFSDGVAGKINALSAEASRIAEQLSKLAESQRAEIATTTIDSRLVRRILKLRRDRERYFPAEIFADPAWDMLLDLTAARLEGKRVPVSSLCIAAAVPTTTALRWIRSLTEAGLFDRYIDPTDARRSHVEIAEHAASAMQAYLRAFSEAFAVR